MPRRLAHFGAAQNENFRTEKLNRDQSPHFPTRGDGGLGRLDHTANGRVVREMSEQDRSHVDGWDASEEQKTRRATSRG